MTLSRQALYTIATTAWTVYAIIVRDQDLAILNPTSGKFVQDSVATAATTAVQFTESNVAKGLYSKTGLTKLKDGKYIVMIYRKVGGSFTPATDTLIDKFYYFVKTEMKSEFTSTNGILG